MPSDLTPQQRAEGALMCYCGCADLTVRTCSCGTAARIKEDIAARLAKGQSVDQVVQAYVEERGEQIRSAPTLEGFNLLAWVMPFAAILAAGLAVVALVRRWGARGAAATRLAAREAAPSGSPSSADREALERIEREIRETL